MHGLKQADKKAYDEVVKFFKQFDYSPTNTYYDTGDTKHKKIFCSMRR